MSSALRSILPAVVLAVVIAVLWSPVLGLGALHPFKTVAVAAGGATLMLIHLTPHHPFRKFGPANQVTVLRGLLVALMAGLVAETKDAHIQTLAFGLAILAALLDGVDGWFARRTGMSSTFGARLDMETDALLILVLSILAWQFDKSGAWVLLSGLLRYLFVAAGWCLPWMRRRLFPSFRRKAVAVLQMVCLVVTIAPFVPPPLSTTLAAMGLAALALSFLIDTAWLMRHANEPLR